jgi:DNA-binding protein HU-beta
VTKAQFVDELVKDGRFESRKQAADAVEAIVDGIGDVLRKGGDVNLTGFGKFHVKERASRPGVNPQTGERMMIAGGRVPRFSAGSGLKSKVKG